MAAFGRLASAVPSSGKNGPAALAQRADLLHAVLDSTPEGKLQVAQATVECAEAALQAGDVTQARRCVETYFAESRRYDKDCSPVPTQDQYWCRAQYALALVVFLESQHKKGPELVAGCLEALEQLMKGFDLAVSLSRYTHLVYNGSVHYWRISRVLQRDQLRKHILAFQEKILQGLEKLEGKEEWRVQHLLSLALCCLDAGRSEEALRHSTAATALAQGANLPIHEEAVRLQSYIECLGAKGAGAGGKPAAKKPVPAPAAAAAPKGGAPAAPAPSGGALSADEQHCQRLVLDVASTRPDKAVCEQQLREAWAKVDPTPQGTSKGINMKLVARVGWCAAVVGVPGLAEQCASRAAAAQDVLPRAWSEMVRALLRLQELGQPSAPLDDAGAQAYVKVMDQLDDAITMLLRLKNVDGIHECCRLIWNAGLPLLQPELRKNVKRTFASAAKALDVIGSPLHQLRVQLHLEVAKCELADESQLKAFYEVHRALALDYVVVPEEEAKWQLQRPLDRFLEPLEVAGRVRSQEPANYQEEAVLLIERSKESRSPAIRADYIKRAIEKLSQVPLPPAPEAGTTDAARAGQHGSCRRITSLWGDLVRSAWAGKLDDLVREAAPFALAPAWTAAADTEMVMLQADVSYIEAEACAAALHKYGQEVVPPLEPSPPGVADNGVRQPPSTVEQLQHGFCEALFRGMTLALDAGEAWQVANGAIRAWNIVLPVLRQHRAVEVRVLLEGVVERLLQLATKNKNGSLLASLVTAYAQALEHAYLLELLQSVAAANATQDSSPAEAAPNAVVAGAEAEPFIGWRYGETAGYQVLPTARARAANLTQQAAPSPRVVQARADLLKGAKACEQTLAKLGSVQAQRLLEAYARLQQLQGLPATIPAGSSSVSEQTSKVVKIIESISQAGSTPLTKLAADASEALALLNAMEVVNVELWAKLGRAAAACQLWATAVQCCQGALKVLPAELQQKSASAADVPLMTPATWFWLAVAHVAHGEAAAALLRGDGADAAGSTQLRAAAADKLLTAAQYASFVGKHDLVEAAVQKLWNVLVPVLHEAVLLKALQPSLQGAVALLNKCKAVKNVDVQVRMNCALLRGCIAAGQLQEGLQLCTAALKAVPQASHPQLLVCKSIMLARLGQQVPEEMSRLGVYPAPVQAEAWLALAHEGGNRADQAEAYRKAAEAVKAYPWLQARSLLEYAEWLYNCGPSGALETLEDALVAAAGHLVDLDAESTQAEKALAPANATQKGGSEAAGPALQRTLSRSSSQRVASTSGGSISGQRTLASLASMNKRQRSSTAGQGAAAAAAAAGAEGGSGSWTAKPKELQAEHMEQLLRTFYLLSRSTRGQGTDFVKYLLAAQYYGTRLAAAALHLATAAANTATSTGLVAPSAWDLSTWTTYQLPEAVDRKLAADTSTSAISKGSIPRPDLTLAYLRALARDLQQQGYHLHGLPICHLAVMVARHALGSEAMAAAASLQLAALLDDLALPEVAAAVEAAIPDPAALHPTEEQASQNALTLHAWVDGATTTCRAEAATRPRSAAMSVGRLAFLGPAAAGGRPKSRSRPPSREGPGAYVAGGGADAEGGHEQPVDPVAAEQRWPPLLWAAQCMADPANQGAGPKLPPAQRQGWLQPASLHDAWLQRAQHLARRGHSAAATQLAQRALSMARATGNTAGEAQCHVLLAQQLLWTRQPDKAVAAVQEGQSLGGPPDVWVDLISCYVACRLAGRDGTYDAWEAVEGGLQLSQAVGRGDKMAQTEARAAEAALRLLESRLAAQQAAAATEAQLKEELHSRAVAAVRAAAAAFQQLGEPVQYVLALLQQAALLGKSPQQLADERPRLRERLALLQEADAAGQKLLREVRPPGLPANVSLPATRLLADILLQAADINLQLARLNELHKASDRAMRRPVFPLLGAKDSSAVTRFVDDVDAEEAAACVEDPAPEELAMTSASSAANLAGFGWRKARALRVLGASQYVRYLQTVPAESHPTNTPKSYLQALPPPPMTADETEAAATAAPPPSKKKAGKAAKEGGIARTGSTTADLARTSSTAPEASLARTTTEAALARTTTEAALARTASVAEDTGASSAAPAPIESPKARRAAVLRGQALQDLQAAAGLAQQQSDWAGLRAAALDLALCYGHSQPQQAAESLCLAQSAMTTEALQQLLERSTAPQSLEYLLHKQASQLAAGLPLPGQNPHFQRARANLAASGPTHAFLTHTLPPAPILAALPPTLTLLLFHLSPDRATLHLAAINVPRNTGTPTPAAPGKPVAPKQPPAPDTSPSVTFIDSMPVDPADLNALTHNLHTWRKALRAILLDPSTPLPPHLVPPPTPSPPAALSPMDGEAEGGAAAAGDEDAAQPPDGASKPGTAKEPAGSSKSKPPTPSPKPPSRGQQAVPDAPQRQFPEALDTSWQWLVQQMEQLLEPLMPALQAALHVVPDAAQGNLRQQVCLLLDMELAALPWEALQVLRHSTVSRCFSLHMLHACLPPPGQAPTADLARMACVVDPCFEQSTDSQVPPGAHNVALAPKFNELAAGPYGKDWAVLEGQAGRTPGDTEYRQLLGGASGLLFFGLSRALAFLRPQVVAALDLRGCDLALLLDRADNPTARTRQQQADNCKAPDVLRLETPACTAALLMARGVRTVVLNGLATTTGANSAVLGEALKRLAGGQQVGAAVDEVRRGVLGGGAHELECAAAGLQVYGVPWMVCTTGAGRVGGKGAAAKR